MLSATIFNCWCMGRWDSLSTSKIQTPPKVEAPHGMKKYVLNKICLTVTLFIAHFFLYLVYYGMIGWLATSNAAWGLWPKWWMWMQPTSKKMLFYHSQKKNLWFISEERNFWLTCTLLLLKLKCKWIFTMKTLTTRKASSRHAAGSSLNRLTIIVENSGWAIF